MDTVAIDEEFIQSSASGRWGKVPFSLSGGESITLSVPDRLSRFFPTVVDEPISLPFPFSASPTFPMGHNLHLEVSRVQFFRRRTLEERSWQPCGTNKHSHSRMTAPDAKAHAVSWIRQMMTLDSTESRQRRERSRPGQVVRYEGSLFSLEGDTRDKDQLRPGTLTSRKRRKFDDGIVRERLQPDVVSSERWKMEGEKAL